MMALSRPSADMAAPAIMAVRWLHFPRLSYARGWKLQQHLLDCRLKGLDPGEGLGSARKSWSNLVLSLEHPHVYTLGRRADAAELHFRPGGLNAQVDADVFRVDRGGKITYHGPGQLVVYPILDLNMFKRDLHWYVDRIEQVVIDSLSHFDIKAHRYPGFPGVWVGERKIAQVGMNVSKWYSMHGFAINVNPDLNYFGNMIPCGIKEKGVTSVKQLLQEREKKALRAAVAASASDGSVRPLHEMRSNDVTCEAMLRAVKSAFAEHFSLSGDAGTGAINHEVIHAASGELTPDTRPEGILDKSYLDSHVDISDLIEKIKDEPMDTKQQQATLA
jgi:lipoyl(octanoyl) transferase